MINSNYKVFKKIKFFVCFIFSLSILSCGSFSSTGYVSNDGIYGKKQSANKNTNGGLYYKNYFDQKAEEYGLTETNNDSIVTDVNNYSSSTNSSKLSYSNSYGSWGDSPSSINFIYRDNPYYGSYWSGFYSPYSLNSWYNYNYPFYNSFYSWGYPYERYVRYSYWDYMFRPWGYGNYWGYGGYWGGYNGYNNYYNQRDNNDIAFLLGLGYEDKSKSHYKSYVPKAKLNEIVKWR